MTVQNFGHLYVGALYLGKISSRLKYLRDKILCDTFAGTCACNGRECSAVLTVVVAVACNY